MDPRERYMEIFRNSALLNGGSLGIGAGKKGKKCATYKCAVDKRKKTKDEKAEKAAKKAERAAMKAEKAAKKAEKASKKAMKAPKKAAKKAAKKAKKPCATYKCATKKRLKGGAQFDFENKGFYEKTPYGQRDIFGKICYSRNGCEITDKAFGQSECDPVSVSKYGQPIYYDEENDREYGGGPVRTRTCDKVTKKCTYSPSHCNEYYKSGEKKGRCKKYIAGPKPIKSPWVKFIKECYTKRYGVTYGQAILDSSKAPENVDVRNRMLEDYYNWKAEGGECHI